MSQKEQRRERMKQARRDFRQDKMERAARKKAWQELWPDLKKAMADEAAALKAMQEQSTEETRRSYLAAKICRMAREEQARKCWL